MLEWLKRHAWKACIGQKPIPGSNPGLSADNTLIINTIISVFFFLVYADNLVFKKKSTSRDSGAQAIIPAHYYLTVSK